MIINSIDARLSGTPVACTGFKVVGLDIGMGSVSLELKSHRIELAGTTSTNGCLPVHWYLFGDMSDVVTASNEYIIT